MLRQLIAIITCLCCTYTQAQVIFEARIDSMAILVGQQTRITLDLTADNTNHVLMPEMQPGQLLVGDVEVVHVTPIDTTRLNDGRRIQCQRTITVTSFCDHDTLYQIPAFNALIDTTEVHSNALALKVFTLDVDTLVSAGVYFPMKEPIRPSLTWYEIRTTVFLGIAALLLLILAVVTHIFLRKGKPLFTIRTRIEKHIPPHQRAMNAMQRIKTNRQAIEAGSKEYYTQLTDVLRKYISERFNFNAMEMTSSEIIHGLLSHDSSMVSELRELFQTADLVKFAKASIDISENDRNLVNAITYIDATKRDEQPEERLIKTQLTEQQMTYNRQRRLMQTVLATCLVLVGIYLIYLIFKLYDWFI